MCKRWQSQTNGKKTTSTEKRELKGGGGFLWVVEGKDWRLKKKVFGKEQIWNT